MEIIRGSLDVISRPASSEQTGSRDSSVSSSRKDRRCPTTPFTLEVLTKGDEFQWPIMPEGTIIDLSSSDKSDTEQLGDNTDGEEMDAKLQEAIEEMKRLDEILAALTCKEKEARRQRMEQKRRLWQELQNKPEGRREGHKEALNTWLFFNLEAPIVMESQEEEEDFEPLFQTQVPDFDGNIDGQLMGQSEKRPDKSTESFEAGAEETGEEQFEGSHCGASKGKKKQRDFVKRNIELVSKGQTFLTNAEKMRLEELLREIDEEEEEEEGEEEVNGARGADGELVRGDGRQVLLTAAGRERLVELLGDKEEEDGARGADSEDNMWAVSVLTDRGNTPQSSVRQQLNDIDSKLRLLLPEEEFPLVQSCTDLGIFQARGSEVGRKREGDLWPADEVHYEQYMKERTEQERRLREIDRQLEILSRSQEMTEVCLVWHADGAEHLEREVENFQKDESSEPSEEQLCGLLDGCELTELEPPV